MSATRSIWHWLLPSSSSHAMQSMTELSIEKDSTRSRGIIHSRFRALQQHALTYIHKHTPSNYKVPTILLLQCCYFYY